MNETHSRRPLVLLMLVALFVASVAVFAVVAGSVVGTVVDADEKGVEGIDVSLYASPDAKNAVATTQTAADGKFALKAVPQGKGCVVKAVKPKSFLGLRAEQQNVDVDSGKTADIGKLELKVPVNK